MQKPSQRGTAKPNQKEERKTSLEPKTNLAKKKRKKFRGEAGRLQRSGENAAKAAEIRSIRTGKKAASARLGTRKEKDRG